MHLHLIMFPFPAGMRVSDCPFSSDEASVCKNFCHFSASQLGSHNTRVFLDMQSSVKYCLNLCLGTGFISSQQTYRRVDYLVCCTVHRCFCPPTGKSAVSIDLSSSIDMEPLWWNRMIKALRSYLKLISIPRGVGNWVFTVSVLRKRNELN